MTMFDIKPKLTVWYPSVRGTDQTWDCPFLVNESSALMLQVGNPILGQKCRFDHLGLLVSPKECMERSPKTSIINLPVPPAHQLQFPQDHQCPQHLWGMASQPSRSFRARLALETFRSDSLVRQRILLDFLDHQCRPTQYSVVHTILANCL